MTSLFDSWTPEFYQEMMLKKSILDKSVLLCDVWIKYSIRQMKSESCVSGTVEMHLKLACSILWLTLNPAATFLMRSDRFFTRKHKTTERSQV